MKYSELKNKESNPTTGGRYYPELELWVWDGVEDAILAGKITEEMADVMVNLAIVSARIGKKQLNNTYSEDVTESDIREAFESDDFFASHFSVSKKEGGVKVAKTYREEYPDEIAELENILSDALNRDVFKEHQGFTKYLNQVLVAIKSDQLHGRRPKEWLDVDITLATQSDEVFMYFHPLENYWDNTQNKFKELVFPYDDPWKNFWEAKGFVESKIISDDFVQEVKTYALSQYSDVIQSNSRIAFIDMLFIAGDNAKEPNSGQNLPNDQEIRETYGKQIFMYSNTIAHKGKYLYMRFKEEFFEPTQVSETEFTNGNLAHVLQHEILHNAERFTVGWLEEMKASLLSLHITARHEKQGFLSHMKTSRNGLYEAMLARMLYIYKEREDTLAKFYYIGENIMLNRILNNGGIELLGKKLRIDYDRMEEAINSLAEELLELQDSQKEPGFTDRAEEFRKKYFNEEIFQKLELDSFNP